MDKKTCGTEDESRLQLIPPYQYIPLQFMAGVFDALYLKYSIVIMFNSERMRKIIGRTIIPNLVFTSVYFIISRFWILNVLLYLPLVLIQFLVNYYMLLKANSALGKLFNTNNNEKFDLVEKIVDTVSDSLFCNITLVTSTILYHIFRNIGVFNLICEIVYALVYSMIMGYTISLNALIEAGLKLNDRLFFIENHLVYLIGYGAPMTLGYYTLPLVVYFAIQAVLIPLMIVNSKEHFKPQAMLHTIPIVTFLNKLNHLIFETMLNVLK